MKILVLNGSPRPNGNTAAMVKAFQAGAEEAGHSVTVIDVARKKINGCLACEYCHTKGHGVCVQKDDMQDIISLLDDVDVLVLASPLYYFTLSAQIQLAIQRTYCIGKPPVKKMAMLLSSHSPNVYDGAVHQYKGIVAYCGLEDAGIITAYGDENKSEAKLAEVKAFAKAL